MLPKPLLYALAAFPVHVAERPIIELARHYANRQIQQKLNNNMLLLPVSDVTEAPSALGMLHTSM